MGLNSAQVILPGRGTAFTAAPDTAPFDKATVDPASAATYTGWDCIGHTSRDNTVSLSKEGGEATNRGSWWDPNLRATRDPNVWGFTMNSLQVDELTLGLAFPGGEIRDGGFWVPSATGSVERAVYILMADGSARAGLYFPRVDISIGDAPEIATDSFFEIQLSGSLLSATATTPGGANVGDLIGIFPPVALPDPAP
ncbi:phage tail tube protein [Thalassiella azotivora]